MTLARAEDELMLREWSLDAAESDSIRYAALRRLEAAGSEHVVPVAAQLLASKSELLRVNAIAVLVRSDSKIAKDALRQLSPEDMQLVSFLMNRRVR